MKLTRRTFIFVEWRTWGCSGFGHWQDWAGVKPLATTLHIGPLVFIRMGP